MLCKRSSLSAFYDIDHIKEFTNNSIKELNEFFQGYRILCVSESIDSVKMWELYAENHKGIALRILPNEEKDSKFKLFRMVEYHDKRPSLYEGGLSFLYNVLFGDHEINNKDIMDKIIYAKTLEWQHEKEYRLPIPVLKEKNWNLVPYHPEEIIELYLGAKTDDEVKAEIIDLAKSVNPNISIFKCMIDEKSRISFHLQWDVL